MTDQETEHALTAVMKEIILTVKDLLKQRRIFPALILIYSGLDIVSSLLRPKPHADTSGEDFKKWVDHYVLKGSSLPTTSDDLWAARCGLLHTNTPGSRSSRSGKAREIHYTKGDKKWAEFAQQEFQKAGEAKVIVDIDALFDAVLDGMMKFASDTKTDAAVRETSFTTLRRSSHTPLTESNHRRLLQARPDALTPRRQGFHFAEGSALGPPLRCPAIRSHLA